MLTPDEPARFNNPAGRLFSILRLLEQGGTTDERSLYIAAYGILPEPSMTKAKMSQVATELQALCDQIKHLLERGPLDRRSSYALAHWGQVEFIVRDLPSDSEFSYYANRFSHRGWLALEQAALLLSERAPEPFLQFGTARALLRQVDDLLAQVVPEDELSEDIIDLVIDHLRDLRDALIGHALYGAEGIERALDRLWGSAARRPDLWSRVAESRWGPRIGRVAGALLLALSAAGGAPALMPASNPPAPIVIENNPLPRGSAPEGDSAGLEKGP